MKKIANRLLELMSRLSWQGTENWEHEAETRQAAAIPVFKDWLNANLIYIVPSEAQEALRGFYINYAVSSPKTAALNRWLDRGRAALTAVYKYQQIKHDEWLELLNTVHDVAMDMCDDADVLLRKPHEIVSSRTIVESLLLNAVELEKIVALRTDVEPSRSVLYLSAASIARELLDKTEALAVIDTLIGTPTVSSATLIVLTEIRKEITREQTE